MGDHSAPLTMTMMKAVGIVQHYMVEGGGSVTAITVSLLVPILVDRVMINLCGVLDHHLPTLTSHMWR